MKQEILHFVKEAEKARKQKDKNNCLNDYCFFLKDENILAFRNPVGDSRYPYTSDGLTMWTYASGNISINQSNFFIIPPTVEGKEPYINFYGGIKNKEKYDVFSITGNADTELGINHETYVVFTPSYCYYIRKIKGLIFAVKSTISSDKRIIFSTMVINTTKKNIDAFISFYFNPLLIHSSVEDEETKWFRKIELNGDNIYFSSVEDLSREVHLHNFALLRTSHNGDKKDVASRRMDYVGDKNYSIGQSSNLRNGFFKKHLESASFVDMVAYGDIVSKQISPKDSLRSNYQVQIAFTQEEFDTLLNEPYNLESNDETFKKNLKPKQKGLSIRFGELKDKNLNNNIFNHFLNSVINQVDYCSKTKNSSLMLLGVRDVYQMLEASLIWDKESARKKILESLSYLDPSGRAPRQYAKESKKGDKPLLDNREFIDQGQWIISTIWKYLAFTNDYSLLKEKCGYCRLIDRKGGEILEEKDSVYEHLKKIINYLISNIDEETNCLKVFLIAV